MSIIYDAKLRTRIEKASAPLLHDFLMKCVNAKQEPGEAYFSQFDKPSDALLAFRFIRYSRAPEFVWSRPHCDWDVDDIATTWLKHSECNEDDKKALQAIGGVTSESDKEASIKLLKEYIRTYPVTFFRDDTFFFNNEYSSNDSFDFERLLVFLNDNRDETEPMYAAFEADYACMPSVTLHLEGVELILFEGASAPSGNNYSVQYDWNGFYCGDNYYRAENNLAAGEYQFVPPKDVKFKVDWLNEDDVRKVKKCYDSYVLNQRETT